MRKTKRILQNPTLFQAMFEEATIGILVVNQSGEIVNVNPFTLQLFGYSREELIGQSVEMLLPETFRPIHRQHRNNYYQNPVPRVMGAELDLYGLRKNGASFPIEISLSHVQQDGELLAIAYINDDSSRKRMLEALAESESRLSAVINTAVDGIITISTSGVVETINPAAARLFGYAPEEVIGQKINMLMTNPERIEHDQYLHNYQSTGEKKIIGIGREVTGRRKDGSTFPFYLGVNEVKLKNKSIYTGILHDLSEQKLAEEKVRRYTKALERSNRELQDFAYVSSHDLQEPLRKIRAFGDRLKSKAEDKLNDKEKDYLDRMLNGAARMQTLISDLLEFSRVNTRGNPFEKIDLNEVLDKVLSDLEIYIRKNNATVEVGKMPTLEADTTQMWQLFQNLIKNAIKFNKEGIAPHVKVYSKKINHYNRLRATPGDTIYKIYVEDNGIGFDNKYSEKIFQIFQRLEGRKFEGSGIGLAVCQRIANRHGGDIEAKGIPDEGATFIVTLAAEQPKEQQN